MVTANPRRGQGAAVAFLRANLNYDGEGCLTWPFTRLPSGYGHMGWLGNHHYAHRLMCEFVNGPPPTPEHEAAHSCGRGKFGCVDPRHLSWKTISENSLDCREHGTQARCRNGNRGHLTETDVQEIRALEGYLTQAEVAEMFGVSQPTIRDIYTGRSWVGRKLRMPFTPAEVIAIRKAPGTQKEIAARFNSNVAAIGRIRNGRTYTDITDGQSIMQEKR